MSELYGTEGFDEQLQTHIKNVYQLLKQEDTPTKTKGMNISIYDFLLISVVCNQLYGNDITKRGEPSRGSYHRIVDTVKVLKHLLGDLINEAENIKENITSHKGTTVAVEETAIRSANILLKMMFVICENIVGLLRSVPNNPYTLMRLIEGSLDKAFIKRNYTVRHKPVQGEKKDKEKP